MEKFKYSIGPWCALIHRMATPHCHTSHFFRWPSFKCTSKIVNCEYRSCLLICQFRACRFNPLQVLIGWTQLVLPKCDQKSLSVVPRRWSEIQGGHVWPQKAPESPWMALEMHFHFSEMPPKTWRGHTWLSFRRSLEGLGNALPVFVKVHF